MIVFVLLNLFCFILLLLKFAWADKSGWNKTTHNVMNIFAPFYPQTQLLTTNSDSDDENETCGENQCDQCDECVSEDESDENPLTESSISTPTTELENAENYSGESKQNSGSNSDSDDSAVLLEKNINYLEKTKEIVQSLKDELEKKND
jgi:hypothetical protein